jgi:hypothetical protein
MDKIIETIRNEPIVSRLGLAAILNVLVVAQVIDVDVSKEIEATALAVVNLLLLLSGRSKVTPV